jgi:hypothetical protein
MCVLTDVAVRLGQTTRQVCELASPAVGTQAYWEWKQTGKLPGWLEAWCSDVLTGGKPQRALNLSSASEKGLFGQDIHHDLEADSCQ